jgi:hypothetical protein
MSTNQVNPNGFVITISKVTEEESSAIKASPTQLGQHVLSFIESRIPAISKLNVKVRLEEWNEVHSIEEFILQCGKDVETIGDKDYSTNYWIES